MNDAGELTRLMSRPTVGGAEDRLAALMRAAVPTEGLTSAAHARVMRRLGADLRRRRPLASLRLTFGTFGSIALGVLLTSGAVIAAVSAPRWWPRLLGVRVESVPAVAPQAPRAAQAPAVAPTVALPSVSPPAEATANAAPPAAASSPAATPAVASPNRATTRRAPVEPEPAAGALPVERAEPTLPVAPPAATAAPAASAPAPSALATETALLSAALTRLRQHRDAAGALAALDVYDASAPRGTLRREADGARVDALLMLGRDAEALAVLRTLTLQPRGRDQELRVVRGELAAAADCAGAVDDFARVLAEGPPDRLVERALHGRATCLARLGDPAAARRDLREYLRRFPDGRFAAEARRLAGESEAP